MEGQGSGSEGQSLYSHHGNPGEGGMPIHVECGLVVDKVVLGHVFSEYFCFSLWLSFYYSYPPFMQHNLSSWQHTKTRTEAKTELVRVMCRESHIVHWKAGVVKPEWETVALGWATTSHRIYAPLVSSVQSFFLCPDNGSSRSLQNTSTYLPDSVVSHPRGQ